MNHMRDERMEISSGVRPYSVTWLSPWLSNLTFDRAFVLCFVVAFVDARQLRPEKIFHEKTCIYSKQKHQTISQSMS